MPVIQSDLFIQAPFTDLTDNIQLHILNGLLADILTGINNIVENETVKGWVRFDGSTTPITIGASFNVDSITDNDTGDYTINWTHKFRDSNYAALTSSNGSIRQTSTSTPSSLRLFTFDISEVAQDHGQIYFVSIGRR